MATASAPEETLDEFIARAKAWLPANLPPRPHGTGMEGAAEPEDYEFEKVQQKKLWEGKLAGISYPKEYGGLGYPAEYQRAFNEISEEWAVPFRLNFPTLSILCPTLLDIGTEEQKLEHIPAVLRGEQFMCQFLSEPSGGSDLASARTRADRDGDGWRINGSKIWSSSAHVSDYGFLLARTNWDAVKHAGLTFFLVKIDQPGVTVNRIKQIDGGGSFCEVFFDDLYLPDSAIVGEVGEGWAAVSLQLSHERTSMGGGSPFVSGVGATRSTKAEFGLPELAQMLGVSDDPAVRQLLAEDFVNETVQGQLVNRVTAAVNDGLMAPAASTIIRVNHALTSFRTDDIGLTIAGRSVLSLGTAKSGAAGFAHEYLMRQATAIAGGTTEMSRNVLTERLLGMPREAAADRDVAFGQVKSGRA